MRSTTNKNPVYPDDGAVFFADNSSTISYEDQPGAGTYYYRVTIVTTIGERWISDVVTIAVQNKSVIPGPKDFAP